MYSPHDSGQRPDRTTRHTDAVEERATKLPALKTTGVSFENAATTINGRIADGRAVFLKGLSVWGHSHLVAEVVIVDEGEIQIVTANKSLSPESVRPGEEVTIHVVEQT
jgi:hypothetical protein